MDTTTLPSCIICQKHRGEITLPGGAIFENELIFVSHASRFRDEKDHYLGHVFIETKRHVAELSQLTEPEAQMVGAYAQRISQALMDVLGVVHVYVFIIGDGVPHFHEHLIGRYPNAPREYWGVKVDEWAEAPHGNDDEIAKVSGLLKKYLQDHSVD